MHLSSITYLTIIASFLYIGQYYESHCLDPNSVYCDPMESIKYLYKDGDYLLISLVPLSYPSYKTAHLMLAESIVYAVDEANREIMPEGKSLGYYIYDTVEAYLFETLTKILLRVMLDNGMLQDSQLPNQTCRCVPPFDKPIIGIIGSETSHSTDYISSFTSFTNLPIISYWATSIEFNDRELYPRVFRTISDDGQLALILVEAMKKLGISFVSILSTDEQYGRSGRQELFTYLKKAGICIDIDIQIELPMKPNFPKEMISKAKKREKELGVRQTFIIFAWSDISSAILQEASNQKFHNATWILSSFDNVAIGESIDPEVLDGAITAVADSGVYTEFYEHFWGHLSSTMPHVLPEWTYKYEDKMGLKTVIEMVSDMTTRYYLAGYVRNAVFAFGTSVTNYMTSNQGNCTVDAIKNERCQFDIRDYFENHLKPVSFKGLEGESIGFNEFGALNYPHFRVYDIFRDPDTVIRFKEVARTDKGELVYRNNGTHWIAKDIENQSELKSTCSSVCEAGEQPFSDIGPNCCWICKKCKPGLAKENPGLEECHQCQSNYSRSDGKKCLVFQNAQMSDFKETYIVFLVITVTGICLSVALILLILAYRTRRFVRAMDINFSLFQIHVQLSLFLVSVYVVVGETDSLQCHVYYFVLSPIFTMTFSFLLAKSEKLISIFNSKYRFSKRDVFINNSKTYFLILITIAIDVLITSVVYLQHTDQLVRTDYNPDTLRKEVYCNGGDLIYIKSIYCFLILLVASVQAFRSRNLPPRYNESKSLLFIIVASFLSVFSMSFMMRFLMKKKPFEDKLYTALGKSISNICILIFTFYFKFIDYLMQQKFRGGSRRRGGINFDNFLKTYTEDMERRKSRAAFELKSALKEISG